MIKDMHETSQLSLPNQDSCSHSCGFFCLFFDGPLPSFCMFTNWTCRLDLREFQEFSQQWEVDSATLELRWLSLRWKRVVCYLVWFCSTWLKSGLYSRHPNRFYNHDPWHIVGMGSSQIAIVLRFNLRQEGDRVNLDFKLIAFHQDPWVHRHYQKPGLIEHCHPQHPTSFYLSPSQETALQETPPGSTSRVMESNMPWNMELEQFTRINFVEAM